MPVRTPYFCSGCPHNTSIKVPEGSRAQAGICCQFMAGWMDRSTSGIVQMSGECVDWVGQSPFVKTPHVFQNLGDGTFSHSGLLAIRIASKEPSTQLPHGPVHHCTPLHLDVVSRHDGRQGGKVAQVGQARAWCMDQGCRRIDPNPVWG